MSTATRSQHQLSVMIIGRNAPGTWATAMTLVQSQKKLKLKKHGNSSALAKNKMNAKVTLIHASGQTFTQMCINKAEGTFNPI